MDLNDIDFEGNANNGNANNSNNGNGNNQDVTNLNGNPDAVDINGNNNNNNSNQNNNNGDNNGDDNNNNNNNNNNSGSDNNNNGSNDNNGGNVNDDNTSSTGELEPGTEIEFDGNKYTVDDNGNIIDASGNVFKQAAEVKDWLASVNVDDNEAGEFDMKAIQDAIGINITDENGKDVEFTNDVEGVKNYVNSVIEVKSNEIQQAAINKLFNDNPLVKQFIDYCQVMGTPRGFGEIPDRSGITLDKDNTQQQEYIIRMAAEEFGNKSLNDSYIKYLKDTGKLYDEASVQLEALIAKDKQYREQIEKQAEEQRRQDEADAKNYWKSVSDTIDSREIGGYKIPDTFIKTIDGKKVTVTPNDFFNYLSKPAAKDENGNILTAYQVDLQKLSEKDSLDKQLIDAWLTFTGGSYKDLVDMAIRDEKAKTLRIKSKENSTKRTIRINKPNNNGKTDLNDILL